MNTSIPFYSYCQPINIRVFKHKMFRKIVFLALFLVLQSYVQATNYYFATNGDDSKNYGLSVGSPWKSFEKLNSLMLHLQPGDSVFFRRGDVFQGEVRITQSGAKQSVIYFGAYGKGEKPVFNGTVKVSGWKLVAPNKWSLRTVFVGKTALIYFINGKQTTLGRWPNSTTTNQGYFIDERSMGITRLSSKSIPRCICLAGRRSGCTAPTGG